MKPAGNGLKFLIGFLIAIGLIGCGRNSHHGYRIGNVEVFITDAAISSEQVSRIIQAVQLQTQTFESDWNFRIPPVRIYVQTQIITLCSGESGYYAGCNDFNGMILVWSETDFTCSALYHEYGHSLFGPGHTLSVWPIIDKRGQELAQQLRAQWENK